MDTNVSEKHIVFIFRAEVMMHGAAEIILGQGDELYDCSRQMMDCGPNQKGFGNQKDRKAMRWGVAGRRR